MKKHREYVDFIGKIALVFPKNENKKLKGKIVSVFPEYFILERYNEEHVCFWDELVKVYSSKE